eukprot:TRINITY_DN1179_c0_g1_i2.p1 TRINITY_DN1179_c0_g1~~TRINITY_DN1179_c0_g1_i2.p1  ORF type:complete len:498 (-),score=116.00 TRINITY_DN1179_c0_g1_i2:322-1815(-)
MLRKGINKGWEMWGSPLSTHLSFKKIPTTDISKFKRIMYIVLAFLFTITTSGAIFGFSPLLLILEDEKVFYNLCTKNTTVVTTHSSSRWNILRKEKEIKTCPDQLKALNFMFMLASTCFACVTLPAGFLLDKLGPKITCAIGSIIFGSGVALFAISSPTGLNLFTLGFVLMGSGGPPIVLSFFNLSNLFPNRKGLIITLFNVGIDASSIVFFIFELIYSYFGVKRSTIFYIYLAVPALILIISIAMWPSSNFPDPPQESNTEQVMVFTRWGLAEESFWRQLTSAPFVLGVLYMAIQLLRVNFYISTVQQQLEGFVKDPSAQQSTIDLWVRIFGLALPGIGIVSTPLVGYILDTLGLNSGLFWLTLSGIAYAGVGLLVFAPLPVQAVTYALIAFFRAILFSGMGAFIAIVFGIQNFGKLWGTAFFISGIFNIGEYFSVSLIYKITSGDFFWPNVILTVIAGLLFYFPVYIYFKNRKFESKEYRALVNDDDQSSDSIQI